MKSSQIFDVLDLAVKVRKEGRIFNPLLIGPAGVGKSQIVQKWCKQNNYPFVDIRAAYFEAPDFIGFPSIEKDSEGRSRTIHHLPEIWPTGGQGVILLEEPNRGTSSIMNTMMQLLTDRKVHLYDLPKDWIIVGCMNPETEDYEVNTMDTALKDRFEFFHIDYNKEDFVKYMKKDNWDKSIVHFVESGTWSYKTPDQISKNDGAKYISPRTLSKVDASIKAGFPNEDLELVVYRSILGNNLGAMFYQFKNHERPVSFDELFVDENSNHDQMFKHKEALERLKVFSKPENYKAGIISLTVNDMVENESKCSDTLLVTVCLVLPADQSVNLLKKVSKIRSDDNLLDRLFEQSKKLKDYLKAVLKQA